MLTTNYIFTFCPLDTYLWKWLWNPLAGPQLSWWVRKWIWLQDGEAFCSGSVLLTGFYLSCCFPVPTLVLFPFPVLVSSSFFRQLVTGKRRGKDIFLLKMKLWWNCGVLPVSGVASTGKWWDVPPAHSSFALIPGLLSRPRCPLAHLTPPCPSFHQPLTFDLHWLVAYFLIPKLGCLTKEIFFFFSF